MTWSIVKENPSNTNSPPRLYGRMAVHAALVPGGPRGRVLYFGGYNVNETYWFDVSDHTEHTISTASSPEGLSSDPYDMPGEGEDYNIFCCGHAFLPDGRMLIAGGQLQYDSITKTQDNPVTVHQHGVDANVPGHVGNMMFGGDRQAAQFHPLSNKWVMVRSMNLDPAGAENSGGRWYPTLVTLPNGEVLAVGGHPDRNENYQVNNQPRHSNNTPERYNAGTNEWILMAKEPPAPSDDQITSPFGGGQGVTYYDYQRTHVLGNGNVFFASPVRERNRVFDPITGYFDNSPGQSIAMPADTMYQRILAEYTSVMLPLLYQENYLPRVMLFGAVKAYRAELGNTLSEWEEVPRTVMNAQRSWVCPVLLPTGEVMFTGGTSNPNAAQDNLVMTAEVYDAGINWANGQYPNNVGSWNSGVWEFEELTATVGRQYHSTAILMTDGAVWTGGSNGPSPQSTTPGNDGLRELRKEIFQPWYFDAPHLFQRPEITSSPPVVGYSFAFDVDVEVNDGNEISRVVFLRCGSCTHGYNPDQRYVTARFSVVSSLGNTRTLRITAPPRPHVAPPGYYLLWVLDNNDPPRPCRWAPFIRLADIKCQINENISSYSIHEAEAKGYPATFANGVYVEWDGFLPGEVSTPTISFEDLAGNPISGILGSASSALYEADPSELDVSQRIVYPVHITFTNATPFDLITNGERVDFKIRATMGHLQCVGTLTMTLHPNPRMEDGDPPWLSTDVRVFHTKAGETFSAGIEHPPDSANAPFAYIKDLVDAYNVAPQTDHPFDQLPSALSDDRAPTLHPFDPNSPQDDPIRLYNYAVARVRYHAPDNVDAVDVSVYFRLWTTGWTALTYTDPTKENGSYRRDGNGPNARPLLGMEGGEVNNVPCFAQARASNLLNQNDDLNWYQTLQGQDSGPLYRYFGCWLDSNVNEPRYPREPGGELLSVGELMNGDHQCLVAEIHYATDPIVVGATPTSSDDLSQRNIIFDYVENPGMLATRLAHHTFEIKPSPLPFPHTELPPMTMAAMRHHADELVFEWKNLPQDAHVMLYVPQWNMDEVLRYAGRRNGPPILAPAGDHAIRLRVEGDLAYVPVQGPFKHNIAALLSVQLPPGISKGQTFAFVVRQVDGRRNRIVGATEFRIKVETKIEVRPRLERRLAVMKQIFKGISPTNRWHPVFVRYLDELRDRLLGAGGDPDVIGPIWAGDDLDAPGKTDDCNREPEPCDEKDLESCEGTVVAILYDDCGDFEGFILDKGKRDNESKSDKKRCDDKKDKRKRVTKDCIPSGRRFTCRKRGLEKLVRKLCKKKIRVCVRYCKSRPECAVKIVQICK